MDVTNGSDWYSPGPSSGTIDVKIGVEQVGSSGPYSRNRTSLVDPTSPVTVAVSKIDPPTVTSGDA